jgi:hypothetical protein
MTLHKQIIAAALALGFVAAAGAWQGPSRPAPGGNVGAPVNVSAAAQSKQGTLGVGGLGVFGRGFFAGSGYSLPANLQLGVNGAIGATAYCDAAGQNCVTSLGQAPATTTTTPATGGSWSNVPLDQTSAFDTGCEYRWKIGDTKTVGIHKPRSTYYATIVAPNSLTWGLSNDSQIYIPSDDRRYVHITPYGRATAWGLTVSSIERRCN